MGSCAPTRKCSFAAYLAKNIMPALVSLMVRPSAAACWGLVSHHTHGQTWHQRFICASQGIVWSLRSLWMTSSTSTFSASLHRGSIAQCTAVTTTLTSLVLGRGTSDLRWYAEDD